MKSLFSTLLLICLVFKTCYAQTEVDRIYLIDDQVIEGKIIESNKDKFSIKVTTPSGSDIQEININEISYILFANGKRKDFQVKRTAKVVMDVPKNLNKETTDIEPAQQPAPIIKEESKKPEQSPSVAEINDKEKPKTLHDVAQHKGLFISGSVGYGRLKNFLDATGGGLTYGFGGGYSFSNIFAMDINLAMLNFKNTSQNASLKEAKILMLQPRAIVKIPNKKTGLPLAFLHLGGGFLSDQTYYVEPTTGLIFDNMASKKVIGASYTVGFGVGVSTLKLGLSYTGSNTYSQILRFTVETFK